MYRQFLYTGFQFVVDGTASDDQDIGPAEAFPFFRDLQRVVDLQRDHGGEPERRVDVCHRMAGRFVHDQVQPRYE